FDATYASDEQPFNAMDKIAKNTIINIFITNLSVVNKPNNQINRTHTASSYYPCAHLAPVI
ncbi:MAG: hypothetical protein V3V18_07660, partial [Methylococcales bacterium]